MPHSRTAYASATNGRLRRCSVVAKYDEDVVVVTGKHLDRIAAEYPDAEAAIRSWRQIVMAARWTSFADVVRTINDADSVNGYVVFNIRKNRYRLITVIHYAKFNGIRATRGHVYVRSFLTHKEYDDPANWDKEFGQR